ncbi:hypothetical protein Bca4012_020185 [Brassica carinata]
MEECSATQYSSFASSEISDSSFGITSSSVQGLSEEDGESMFLLEDFFFGDICLKKQQTHQRKKIGERFLP